MTKGGKREGAGRPAPHGTGKRRQVYIKPDVWDYLTRNGNKASARIENLAREKMDKEQQARKRIEEMDFGQDDREFIFADWDNWGEHIDWLLTASRDEIASWIKAGKE